MREAQVYAMHNANAKRNALMFGQWEFINTRMVAYEVLLSQRKNVLMAIFMPKRFKKAVDNLQLSMINESKKQFEEASKKPHLTRVNGV